MTDLMYGRLSNSTLDELAEYFEELPEFGSCPADYDVQYGVCQTLCVYLLYHRTYYLYHTEWSTDHQGWT